MTDLQRLEIRAGAIRQRLSDIGGMDELSDEVRSEFETLRREYSDNESKQAALKIGGDAPSTPLETRTGEGREFRQLVTRSNVGEIFDAALNHNVLTGASREIQEHYGLDTNQVPLALLVRSWPDDRELETRAAGVTNSPSNVGRNEQSILPYVFPMAAATFLGVDMPTVGVGEAVFPVLATAPDVHTPAEHAAAADTAHTFSAQVLSPSRIQAAFFYSREDRAKFAGMDSALRENLSMGLSDGLDKEVLAGTNGLFTGTVLANNNVTAVTDFDGYISEFGYNRVDGRYASTAADISAVVGSATYAHMGETYRNTSVDRTALDRLMDITGGVRVSSHVPAVSNANKQNAVIRRGMHTDMVAPIWEGVTLITDEVTKAANGQIVVTGVMLHAVKLIRADGYHKQQTQHA